MNKLFIVGFGVGDDSLLTRRAREVIDSSSCILSTGRISQSHDKIKCCQLSEIEEILDSGVSDSVSVLVSGDVCFYSLSKRLVAKYSNSYDLELINGISSIQYFSAKLSVSYDDALILSMHGKDSRILAKTAYNKKIFALTGGEFKAQDICRILDDYDLGHVRVSVGENLSYDNERVLTSTASVLKGEVFQDLSVIYIENIAAVSPHEPIKDQDFIRGNTPMTKEEIRWLSIQKLGVTPSDIVYDIGAGTGSVAVEMARKASCGHVYAVEMKLEAVALIKQNRQKHGAYNMDVLEGKAPESLDALPAPTKAFIGGSSGNMDDILSLLIKKNPDIKITANAITLQTLNQTLECFNKYALVDIDIVCVNVAKACKAGSYDMMISQNPVYIITGTGLGLELGLGLNIGERDE